MKAILFICLMAMSTLAFAEASPEACSNLPQTLINFGYQAKTEQLKAAEMEMDAAGTLFNRGAANERAREHTRQTNDYINQQLRILRTRIFDCQQQ